MELKSVNGANYLVISKLLQRNAWAAQYEANDALEQGFSSDRSSVSRITICLILGLTT